MLVDTGHRTAEVSCTDHQSAGSISCRAPDRSKDVCRTCCTLHHFCVQYYM